MPLAPRVRRIVFFKHGLAHVERAGPCSEAFELSFDRDVVKDVLKSLAIWVAAGDARPRAIGFDKPEDPSTDLAAAGLALRAGRVLSDLLGAFGGRRIALREGEAMIRGELVGIEERKGPQGSTHQVLVLRSESGTLRIVAIERIVDLRFEDSGASADLDFLLERQRAARSTGKRTVRVAVEGRAEDLRVAYVVPAPVWRVTYRIVRQRDAILLAAWAVVHNPLDEEIVDAEVTLTTGQPISFDIDLYRPRHETRTVLEERRRAAAAPTRYEPARSGFPTPGRPPVPGTPMDVEGASAARRPRDTDPGEDAVDSDADDDVVPEGGWACLREGDPPPPPAASMAEQIASSAAAAELGMRGEFFEYRIAQPITLPRNGSALVPLIASRMPATQMRIWRVGSPAPHPDIVLALRNETGAVLEEGPVLVYDEGVYAGESMLPYTARGSEVSLGYAKDLAVRCRHERETHHRTAGLRFDAAFVVEERWFEERHAIRVESDHGEPVLVVIEAPRRTEWRLLDDRGARPFEETASHRRFRVEVPPRASVELEFVESMTTERRIQCDRLAPEQLERWARAGVLRGPLRQTLEEAVRGWAEAAEHQRTVESLYARLNDVHVSQSRIVGQLQVLKESGPEGELRVRYAHELARAHEQAQELERQIAAARDAAQKAREHALAWFQHLLRQVG